MGHQKFEEWIKLEQPQITDTQRYPRTIKTISNHLKKQGIDGCDLYLVNDVKRAKKLKEIYFGIDEYFLLNDRGNNMYSRAFDLYIQFLEVTSVNDEIANDIQGIIEQTNIENTEKTSLIQSRIGQGKFRENLVDLWGGCSVTKCNQISLLVASHIKPWSKSSNQERLDPYNGFLLLPNLDKAFDLGFISFESSGNILISSELPEYKLLGISKGMYIQTKEKNKIYLEYHRSHVFKNT
ncbi:MAG: HNH endonuclease [Desulfocapsa sp.]|nr:HNH endonuclease [Desulfocapsa sp.]MBL4901859.1 HNH endonuclease [Desulfocapsa sp.]